MIGLHSEICKRFYEARENKMPFDLVGTIKLARECAYWLDMPFSSLIAHNRRRETVAPRQMAIYCIRNAFRERRTTLLLISKVFGLADHTTVLHSLKTWEELIYHDKDARVKTERLISYLKKLKY